MKTWDQFYIENILKYAKYGNKYLLQTFDALMCKLKNAYQVRVGQKSSNR